MAWVEALNTIHIELTVFLMLTSFVQCWLSDVDIASMIRVSITQWTCETSWAITNFIGYCLNTATNPLLVVWQGTQAVICIQGDSVDGIGHRVLVAAVVPLCQRHSLSTVLTCVLCIDWRPYWVGFLDGEEFNVWQLLRVLIQCIDRGRIIGGRNTCSVGWLKCSF